MSFILRNLTVLPLPIDDLGIELAASEDYDMLQESPQDVQTSGKTGGDIFTAINAGDAIILSPSDGVTPLSIANSLAVASLHNDPNWGINGGALNDLDDVDTSTANPGDVLQLNGGGTSFDPVTPATLAADIDLNDLNNVADATGHANTDVFILKGDGAGGFTVEDGRTDAIMLDHIQDTAGNQLAGATQTDLTVTYIPGTNALDLSVDDNFLRNTGDTLDSGTLAVATGGFITTVDAPINPTDVTNKAYVDSLLVAGLQVVNIPASVGTQPVLVLADTTRANKLLSVGDTPVVWSENKVGNNSWMNIGGAVDALTGYIVPLNATIVKVTAHTSDNKGNTKALDLFVNGALNSTVATFNGLPGEDTDEDVTLDIDVAAGDKLRIMGGAGGSIEDTVITLWLKWRG